jgi:hypothetical protein
LPRKGAMVTATTKTMTTAMGVAGKKERSEKRHQSTKQPQLQ